MRWVGSINGWPRSASCGPTKGGAQTLAAAFLADVRAKLGDAKVAAFGADRYRQSEVIDYMTEAGVKWPTVWRGVGAGKVADGSADLRAFQKGVLDRWLRPACGVALMLMAIEGSEVRRDPSGTTLRSRRLASVRVSTRSRLRSSRPGSRSRCEADGRGGGSDMRSRADLKPEPLAKLRGFDRL